MPSTEDRAPDPRPARTRAAIFSAARALGADDGEVTVNALVKRAGVSRAAFYTHFSGLDDLIGAMFVLGLEKITERSAQLDASGMDTHQQVRSSVRMTARYVAEHHAFLRGALEWKFSRRPYLTLVTTFADLHELALEQLDDAMPPHLPRSQTARFLAGGMIEVIIQWLLDSEKPTLEDGKPDAEALTAILLTVLPSWYTGIAPGDPISEPVD